MGLYNCLGNGGGKTLEETVLWNNSAPTSNMSSSLARTLFDDISNYDYLKIYWRLTVNQDIQSSTIVSVEEFKKMDSTSNHNCIGLISKGTNTFVRTLFYVDDTTFGNGTGYQVATSTQNNGYCIITKISGLKYLDEVKEWSPAIAILGTSSSVARGPSLSMTLTLSSTGIYRIYPVVAYASGNSPYTASMRNPNSCTFTGATLLSQDGNNYTIDATSTSVKIKMATGTTASTSFNMVARVFQLLEN